MEIRGLEGNLREPTWTERAHLDELRRAGVEDVYVEVEQADEPFWQALLMATERHVFDLGQYTTKWDQWCSEFRWSYGLPAAMASLKSSAVFKALVTRGVYPTGASKVRSMSPGQRLAAVEHLLDVAHELDIEVEGFRTAVNERATYFRIGVRLEGLRFIRVTSAHLHAQVTAPTLLLLADPRFETVDGLYRKAFERALSGDHSGAITAATSSVEEMLRVGLNESGGRLQPLLKKARGQGWVIPAVEQMALKLEALRGESDAHTPGTDEPHVAMLAVHFAAAMLVHLGHVIPVGEPAS